MKILHFTDSHATMKHPENRTDVFHLAFFKKLLELEYVCTTQHIDVVVCTGDLFHIPQVSDKFAGQISEIFKRMSVPIYITPGNHDIDGYDIRSIDQTKLGLLAKTGVVELMTRERGPVFFNVNGYTILMQGQEYRSGLETDPNAFYVSDSIADLKILLCHAYIVDVPQPPQISCILVKDVETNADLVLSGHYHRMFSVKRNDGVDFVNPGSMMRIDRTDYNKTHMPHYNIVTIDTDEEGLYFSHELVPFHTAMPSDQVFDYTKAVEVKTHSITLEGYANSIAASMNNINTNLDIRTIITNICNAPENNITSAQRDLFLKLYESVLAKNPDDFKRINGYIESKTPIYITKVVLHNFQCHEDTTIEFVNGMNVIVGETGNGKSTILRAIDWATSNEPSGTTMIMTGKDDCFVEIYYSNGSVIRRNRTRTSAGAWEIKFIDDQGQVCDRKFEGFGSSIPVEVMNVTQMPKVMIAKGLERYLNMQKQHELPFLLSESPQTKAAAIGRITGTHIVDSAIKECNRIVLNENKRRKLYEEEFEKKQLSLKAFGDMKQKKQQVEHVTHVMDFIDSFSKRINTGSNIVRQVSEIESNIIVQTNVSRETLSYLKLRMVIEYCKHYLEAIQRIHQIEELQTKIKENEIVVQHTKQLLYSLGQCFPQVVSMYEDLKKKIEYMKHHIQATQLVGQSKLLVISRSSMIRKMQNVYDVISTMKNEVQTKINLLSSMKLSETSIQIEKNKEHSIDKFLHDNTQKLNEITDQKQQFLQEQEICPCCGQKILKHKKGVHIHGSAEQ